MKFFQKILFLFLVIPNLVFADFTWDAGQGGKWKDGHIVLNTERLYRTLRALNIADVLNTVCRMLLAQPQWGANQILRNTLKDHIVNKGHFGFLPFPSLETPRTEDKGMIRTQRLNVNEPRSYFIASATLEPLIDNYATEITGKLANLRQQDRLKPSGKITVHSPDPLIPHTRIDNDHHTAYETVKNRMLEESNVLLADIIDNNLYVAVAMDFDEKTDTIRIKADPVTPHTMNRQGHQPNVNMTECIN